ncbi:AsnC family transcriptional regulator [Candidatus Thorarchaeota archaeon]|nr:MAG: AsnC family transcriptional regulator [Candidatus Thorarchaeota archaeon]
MTRRSKTLDDKDKAILNALARLGGKASAEDVSRIAEGSLKPRTVRYRIQRLKETGYLERMLAQTHETKIGLGDCYMLLQMAEGQQKMPPDVLPSFPMFYAYGVTFGRYNGVVVNASFATHAPDVITTVLDAFYEKELIEDHKVFEVTDYVSMPPDFENLGPRGDWAWDWRQWVQQAQDLVREGPVVHLDLDLDHSPVDFDHLDVKLISQLKIDAGSSLKELSESLGLSESQVATRQKRLDELGIIKGWRWILADTADQIETHLHFETESPFHPILLAIRRLPFPKDLFAETDRRFYVKIHVPSDHFSGFLRGIGRLRQYFLTHFIQTVTDIHGPPIDTVYGYYSKRTGRWEFDVEEFIHRMEESLQ